LLEDRRRAGDVRTDQGIKEGVIQKQMRGKIKEWLTKDQRRIKKDINKEESNNERKERKKSISIWSYAGRPVPGYLIHTFFM